MRPRSWLLPLALLLAVQAAAGSSETARPDFLNERKPRAKVLLLGSFHFRDAGLDAHKPTHGFEALSDERQKEIAAVLEMLAEFRPTKIAVEIKADRQSELDESYAKYLAGEKELTANEIFQIGFRLGKKLELDRLYAIDAGQRSYFPDMTEEQYEARVGSLIEDVDPARLAAEEAWDERFMKMYDWEDAQLDRQTLQQHLIFLNDAESLRRRHGHYLIGSFKLGEGDDYFGVDLGTAWYNRNLRIFRNIQRISGGPQDRILVLIGAGHVPILRHAVQSSPEYELVEVAPILQP